MANLICFQLSQSGFAANMAPFWKREVLGLYAEYFTTLPPLLVPRYDEEIEEISRRRLPIQTECIEIALNLIK